LADTDEKSCYTITVPDDRVPDVDNEKYKTNEECDKQLEHVPEKETGITE